MARTKLPDIRQIKSGKWLARSRMKGHPDKSKCFNTYTEALEWKTAVAAEKYSGTYADRSKAEKMTLKQAMQRFMDEVTDFKAGKGKITGRVQLKRLMSDPIARFSLASIKPEDISDFKFRRLKSPNLRKPKQLVSKETVRKDMTKISAVFTRARAEWGMPFLLNPVETVELPDTTLHRERLFSESDDATLDEEKLLFAAAERYNGGIHLPILKWLLSSGMRLQEACMMEWSRVDFRTSTFRILGPTSKAKTSQRRAMSPDGLALLESLPRPIRGGLIFNFKSATISQAFGRIAKDAGLINFHLHDLRHVALTRLGNLGLSTFQLMKFSGHASPHILARYCHTDEELAAAEAARLIHERDLRAVAADKK